jgi:hypothetical protein
MDRKEVLMELKGLYRAQRRRGYRKELDTSGLIKALQSLSSPLPNDQAVTVKSDIAALEMAERVKGGWSQVGYPQHCQEGEKKPHGRGRGEEVKKGKQRERGAEEKK